MQKRAVELQKEEKEEKTESCRDKVACTVREFINDATRNIIPYVENAVKSGVRGEALNEVVNAAIRLIEDNAKKMVVTDEDIKNYGTVTMRHVYEEFKDNEEVKEDLRKGVVNRQKTGMVTRVLKLMLRPELERYVKELADVLVDAYSASSASDLVGKLKDAADAARGYLSRTKYGGRWLVQYLFTEAPDSLQHESRAMQKFSRTALATCPGADVCAAQCYALHGNYVQLQVKRSIAMHDLFVDMLKDELMKKLDRNAALAAALLGAAFAGGVEAAGFGRAVRLHDSGDFNDIIYLAGWLTAAKLLPDKTFYTYTKTFPNVPGMPPVWQNAVKIYGDLFGEPPPKNFNVNISGTATNYKYLPGAAEALTGLGISVPGVFFYASANMDKYYEGRPERWRELAAALLEAARKTTGRKLILEFEHGLGTGRSAKSSHHIVKLMDVLTDYAEESGIPLRISVPNTAYKAPNFKNKEEREHMLTHLLSLPPERRDEALYDVEKMSVLNEIATELARKYGGETAQEGVWTKTFAAEGEKKIKVTLKRPVNVFTVPGIGEPVEVFVEPGGEKVCSLCQRCIVAPHSPLKNVTKISLTRGAVRGAGLTTMEELTAMTKTPQPQRKKRRKKRKKAVAV